MNTYIVVRYNTHERFEFVKRVEAMTAAAIARQLKTPFSYTCKDQNDKNSAMRDNAHMQFDCNGYRGIWAERLAVAQT